MSSLKFPASNQLDPSILPAMLLSILPIFALLPRLVYAGPEEDADRLGQYYTNVAIYRSGSGNNVVSVGLGDPEQEFNLTLSELS